MAAPTTAAPTSGSTERWPDPEGTRMFRLALTLLTLAGTTLSAALHRAGGQDGQRGSVTLEQVILALGLFLLAIGVVAGITAAVNGRLAQIS